MTSARPFIHLLFVMSAGMAAVGAEEPLPAAAAAALQDGILAARLPDFPLALRHFTEARRLAPDSTGVYYYLGLTEEQLKARELQAMCWFRAFLIDHPEDPRAPAIRDELRVLNIRSQSMLAGLIQLAQEAIADLPDDKVTAWSQVARMWAESGDLAMAAKVSLRIPNAGTQTSFEADLAEATAAAGDVQGALLIAGRIQDARIRDEGRHRVASAQAEAGDSAGALRTTGSIQEASSRAQAQRAVADALLEHGELIGAQRALQMAMASCEAIAAPYRWKDDNLTWIVEAQLEAGDAAGAGRSAGLIKEADYQQRAQGYLCDPSLLRVAQRNRGLVLVQQGDLGGAQAICDASTDQEACIVVILAIARTQARQGDQAAALATIAQATTVAGGIEPAITRDWAWSRIAIAQAQVGDATGARQTTAIIVDPLWRKEAGRGFQPVLPSDWTSLLDYGTLADPPFDDLSGHLQSLPSTTPRETFDAISQTIWKIIKVRNAMADLQRKTDQR